MVIKPATKTRVTVERDTKNGHFTPIDNLQKKPVKRTRTDHSIVFSCQYHVIWRPKYRRKVLMPPIDQRLKELIQEKQAAYGYEILAMEIMPDHVHLILDVDPRMGINKVVGQIKGWTAHAIREEFPFMKSKLPLQ
ncbi:MAG: IS200/IS605 family transposase [Anaerolinea sp.]|nr:IS200/IS605 family transposase [Anaerolinea sp.]